MAADGSLLAQPPSYACIYFLLLLVNKASAVKHNTVARISKDIFVIKIPSVVMARRPKITLVL